MLIEKILLTNFRNFGKKAFEFSNLITVIVGPNASGKTNILEAIYLLSTGKSFKAKVEEEMIKESKDIARISTPEVKNEETALRAPNTSGVSSLEVVLTRGELRVSETRVEKIPKKKLLVNGVPRRLFNFTSNLKVVLFGPWDLQIVIESPSIRRGFLDDVLSQVNSEYRRAMLSYEKGVRQRNKLLWRIREEGMSRSQLLFWDKLLVKNGEYISAKRDELIKFINKQAPLDHQEFMVEYDKSIISPIRLEQYAAEEVASATTLVGPHRDDFIVKIKSKKQVLKERELARFGSRGEQRMGVLWLKLAELEFIKKVSGERPVLLLDDIFSELDHEHRNVVYKFAKKQQTIITTADPHFVEQFSSAKKITLSN